MSTKTSDERTAVIDESQDTKSTRQGSGSGGEMAREVGQRDELKTATGADPLPTSVDKRDKPEDGDLPTPREVRG